MAKEICRGGGTRPKQFVVVKIRINCKVFGPKCAKPPPADFKSGQAIGRSSNGIDRYLKKKMKL